MSDRMITVLQFASISLIWLFVISIDLWILGLLRVAHRLHDAINASVGIGIVAIPIFLTLASVLTYVFLGLRRHQADADEQPH